jgi:ankyrin repeat protein
MACYRGYTDIVKMLCDTKKINVNAKDDDESTPLHYASESGHKKTILHLVFEAGADPFIKNKFGFTPTDIAQSIDIRNLFIKIMKAAAASNN